jgi:hypothetical protein
MSLLQGHEAGSEARVVPAGIVPGYGWLDASFCRAGVAGVAFWGLLVAVLMLEGRRGESVGVPFCFWCFSFWELSRSSDSVAAVRDSIPVFPGSTEPGTFYVLASLDALDELASDPVPSAEAFQAAVFGHAIDQSSDRCA